MMEICSNRPEGFATRSRIFAPLPTTCFIDTIFIPLPTWVALAILPLLVVYSLRTRSSSFEPSTAHLRVPYNHARLRAAATILYYVLIVANILMLTLEIVRLELTHLGIGLIPFAYVGPVLAAALHLALGRMVRAWRLINAVVWLGGIAMSIISVLALEKEKKRVNGRNGSKYPISDQSLDVGVMAGVYAVTALLELLLAFWKRPIAAEAEEIAVEKAAEPGEA